MKRKYIPWLLLLVWLWLPVSAAGAESRPAWETVEQPFISSVWQLEDGQLEVYVLAVVGEAGGDSLTVILYDRGGLPVLRQEVTGEGDRHTLLFTPEAPGNYSFQAELRRAEEMPKASASVSVAYGQPLGKPTILTAAEQTDGSVLLQWTAVEAAEEYQVLLNGTVLDQVAATEYTVTGLTDGETYTLQVAALRDSERTVSDGVTLTLDGHREHSYGQEWDAQGHWYACLCGAQKDQGAHSLQWVVDLQPTEKETGLQHPECTVCGYEGAAEEIPVAAEAPEKDFAGIWIAAGLLVAAVAVVLLLKPKRCRRKMPSPGGKVAERSEVG